jgi:hypothetical protein
MLFFYTAKIGPVSQNTAQQTQLVILLFLAREIIPPAFMPHVGNKQPKI